jgi:hypothetical protein
MDHQKPVTVTADSPDQPGRLLRGHTNVPLPFSVCTTISSMRRL